ncbi:MAG TPA: adenylate kinase [Thermoanaerobaculia bacterium]|nr:adenylate kinase [Thermoanaerobaculia bacterium]
MADGADCDGTLKVVLLGPPGSGKGTQAAVLSGRMRVPAISTGDMLREAVAAKSELGQKVQGIMAAGSLVDDGTMAEVVRERLARCGKAGGFLLDGYPRTLPQAETLERILGAEGARRLDAVLLVEVPEEELVRRTVARKREDDLETVVRERLRVYGEKTAPLIGYYRGLGLLREIDGNRPVPEVTAQMVAALGLNLD